MLPEVRPHRLTDVTGGHHPGAHESVPNRSCALTLLVPTDRGLHCPIGGFYIDPWKPVDRAVITHAHSDHLSPGSGAYLVAAPGRAIAEARLGGGTVESVAYGVPTEIDGVRVSLHPAGHILGSAQVRVEHRGEVWVISGDYKTEHDPTCAPFELLPSHVFVTECTFGLPVYRWPAHRDVVRDLHSWIAANRAAGRTSILFGYSLGKAQRLLSMLQSLDIPIWTHGAVEAMTALYRAAGIPMPPTTPVASVAGHADWAAGVVVAPPSAAASPWLRRFGVANTAFASGWMLVRGARRRRNADRGFVVSDHVDWPALMATIRATGAERVLATHGFTDVLARYLGDMGIEAGVIPTRWEGEQDVEPTQVEST